MIFRLIPLALMLSGSLFVAAASDAVMSAAIFQFGEEYRVNRKQRPSRMT